MATIWSFGPKTRAHTLLGGLGVLYTTHPGPPRACTRTMRQVAPDTLVCAVVTLSIGSDGRESRSNRVDTRGLGRGIAPNQIPKGEMLRGV